MKKIYLLSCLIAFNLVSFAQTNTFPTDGNVGIGTTSPLYKLDVLGSFRFGGIGAYSSMSMEAEQTPLPGYNQTNFLMPNTVPGSGTARTAFRFKNYSFTLGQNILDVLIDGAVGIGTTAPATTLDVKGHLTLNGEDQSRIYLSNSNTEADKFLLLLNSDSYQSASRLKTGGLLISESYNFANPGKNNLIVSGNVAIGTADAKGYKLAVSGSMIAESVKVKPSSLWPDYVFSKSYQLPTLQETEKHIKEKGHLPGIPSAAEVKTNGIDLGQINAKLLEKIEELTLHLIEQNKTTIKQQEELALQRSLLQKMQKELDLLKEKTLPPLIQKHSYK